MDSNEEAMQEKFDEIARNLLGRLLKEIDWSSCKKHKFADFGDEIENAAARVKAAGIGWEEWT